MILLISNFYIMLNLTSSCPFIFLFGVLIHFYFLSIDLSFQLLSKQLSQIYSSTFLPNIYALTHICSGKAQHK